MIIARVLGSIVSTVKHPDYRATKLMVVQPLDPWGAPGGTSCLAVDSVGAGPGETVLIVRNGAAAAGVVGIELPPIRSVIVGVINQFDCGRQTSETASDIGNGANA